jgi:hypothetical protein
MKTKQQKYLEAITRNLRVAAGTSIYPNTHFYGETVAEVAAAIGLREETWRNNQNLTNELARIAARPKPGASK